METRVRTPVSHLFHVERGKGCVLQTVYVKSGFNDA